MPAAATAKVGVDFPAPNSIGEFLQNWMRVAQTQKVEPSTREEILENIKDDPYMAAAYAAIEQLPPGCRVWPAGTGDTSPHAGVMTFDVTFEYPASDVDISHGPAAEEFASTWLASNTALLQECKAALLEANRNGYVRGHPLLSKINTALGIAELPDVGITLPEGWKATPRHLTPKMKEAYMHAFVSHERFDAQRVFEQILDAAPEPANAQLVLAAQVESWPDDKTPLGIVPVEGGPELPEGTRLYILKS